MSTMEGRSQDKLLDFLGYSRGEKEIPFGRPRRIDERILRFFDSDTRPVGWILKPRESLYRTISDREYIDEWGIRKIYTGLYWESADAPLKNATIKDLEQYQFPNPYSLDEEELKDIEQGGKAPVRDNGLCSLWGTSGIRHI